MAFLINIPLSFQRNPHHCSASLAFSYFSFLSQLFSELFFLCVCVWKCGDSGSGDCTRGICGTGHSREATSSPLRWWWWLVVVGIRGEGGRVSAYPDWTAQVEKTPGSSLIRPREVPRPSLMIDEKVRGWRSPPTSAVKGRGWGGRHSLSGLEDEGGLG